MQNNNNKSEMAYAGFWVRLAAFCIDSIIVFALLLIVRLVMSGVMTVLAETPFGGNILFHYTLKDIVLYLAQAIYFVLFTYYTGTTIGKRAMNLRVINRDGNEKLSIFNVIYRETIGKFLCNITIGIGYLIVGFDPNKRGLHDMLCDTQVIYAKTVKVYEKIQKVPARTEMTSGEYCLTDGIEEAKEDNIPDEVPIFMGYHLTEESKVDIVDEENYKEDNL